MSDKSKKRIVLPPHSKTPTYKSSDAVIMPNLRNILEDAASIVALELSKFKRDSDRSTSGMQADTARAFQGFVKSAIELSREERERDKISDVDEYSDRELLDMYLDQLPKEEVVRLLQDTINDKPKSQDSSKEEAPVKKEDNNE